MGHTHTDQHVLVCLSAAPSNAKIIRSADEIAKMCHGDFTALFVETPRGHLMDEASRNRLLQNTKLAQSLGATVETVYGDDVPFLIAEFARLSQVTKIVIGKDTSPRSRLFRKPSLTDRVIEYAPNIDIYVISDMENATPYYPKSKQSDKPILLLSDVMKVAAIFLFATGIGFLFEYAGLKDPNIVAVYILSVLISAIVTTSRVYTVISSIVSVVAFNFFFTEPRFTFVAQDTGYPITFVIMFVVGMISSTIAIRLKDNAKQSAQASYRTQILFDTNQLLQQLHQPEEILEATAHQLTKLLNRDLILYPAGNKTLLTPHPYTMTHESIRAEYISPSEQEVAKWVMEHNKHAGATTNSFPDAKCLYLAIRAGSTVYGVVGIVIDNHSIDSFENSILLSILGECALALENEKNEREKEEAAIMAKNEQLRSNLLRSISHDLRTPLTSISGNATNLITNIDSFDQDTTLQILQDMHDDADWLTKMVENLLSITRLGEGQVPLHFTTELLADIIEEARRRLKGKLGSHTLQVQLTDDLLLVRCDTKLIVQLFINLIDNAIKYTQDDSTITISACAANEMVYIEVSDDGPGIDDSQKEKVFDMFYSGANRIIDSRRSLGLGLALCRSIVNAHGGKIWITDCTPKGTCFHFTLPYEEVNIHE